MSITLNKANYATPATDYIAGRDFVDNTKYFSLHHNILDGSFKVMGAVDIPAWGDTLSLGDGTLSTPFIITNTEVNSLHTLRLRGDAALAIVPVQFTFTLYNGSTVLYTEEFINTALSVEWLHQLDRAYDITSYEVSISKISVAGVTARVTSVFSPHTIYNSVAITIDTICSSIISELRSMHEHINLVIGASTHIATVADIACSVAIPLDIGIVAGPTNVHTRMRDASRRVHGKIQVSYMNPLLNDVVVNPGTGAAYNTSESQTVDGFIDSTDTLFMLHNNTLDGSYKLIDSRSKVGWWSNNLSNLDGTFDMDPIVSFSCTPRLIYSLTVGSSRVHDILLVDYTINVLSNSAVLSYNIIDNDKYERVIGPISEVSNVEIIVHKINKPNAPANIMELTIGSTVWYNQDDLISLDFLEEISYDDELETMGGVSANSLVATIRNDNKQFYFDNPASLISKQLKKNRKIVAYLGTEIIPGEIEWYVLGTFWTHSWSVPEGLLYAKATAFDTLGLLNTLQYTDRHVLINCSIGYVAELLLSDAKARHYGNLAWEIDASLYAVTVPYVWFNDGTYLYALNELTKSYRFNAYCNRYGKVILKEHSKPTAFIDTWSDSTNIISKVYPTLYTEVPNVINVYVTDIVLSDIEVISNTNTFTVPDISVLSLKATQPIVEVVTVTLDADATVSYTYEEYSWGLTFTFSGTGIVRSLKVIAKAIENKQVDFISARNELSIHNNGVNEKNIAHSFIQTYDRASQIASDILESVYTDVYDIDVEYRGDIALSINDTVRIVDNITPTDKYKLRRNSLYWDGALHGTAKLNT